MRGRPTGTSSGDRRAVESHATRGPWAAERCEAPQLRPAEDEAGDPGKSRGRACAGANGVSLRAAPPSRRTGTRRNSPRPASRSLRTASAPLGRWALTRGAGGPCVAPERHAKSARLGALAYGAHSLLADDHEDGGWLSASVDALSDGARDSATSGCAGASGDACQRGSARA